jgi:hypothetical protein
MNITIQHTQVGRCALINDTIEVLLDDNLPTSQYLRCYAQSLRKSKMTALASLMDDAADCYDKIIH